jgi:hypothetical protein
VRVGTHDRTSDDTGCRSEGGEGGYAMHREWGPAEELSIYNDGECTNDTSGDLRKWGRESVRSGYTGVWSTDSVVTLRARKEVDGGVKVVLGYEAIL